MKIRFNWYSVCIFMTAGFLSHLYYQDGWIRVAYQGGSFLIMGTFLGLLTGISLAYNKEAKTEEDVNDKRA